MGSLGALTAPPPPPSTRLFKPLRLNQNLTLQHRLIMAPMTRLRAHSNHDPILPLMNTYYTQRAHGHPGTLLITEATYISPRASGYPNVPGIFTDSHITAWKEITTSVHAAGSFIFCQLWALGRTADASFLSNLEGGPYPVVSSSPTPLPDLNAGVAPHELSLSEIKDCVQDYATAAKNAMAAGFDGVEIHAANGYLIDQFTQSTCNTRTDAYGGSIENRSRFAVEVATAVAEAVGADKVGIRFSPFSSFQGMGMQNAVSQFTHLLKELSKLKMCYVHICEARLSGSSESNSDENIDFVFEAWGRTSPVFLAGGYGPASRWESASAAHVVDDTYKEYEVGVVFGRYFISNPDLVYRVKKGLELSVYDPATFYKAGAAEGYVDYPYSREWQVDVGVTENTINEKKLEKVEVVDIRGVVEVNGNA